MIYVILFSVSEFGGKPENSVLGLCSVTTNTLKAGHACPMPSSASAGRLGNASKTPWNRPTQIDSMMIQTLAKRERFITRARVRRRAGGRPSMMACACTTDLARLDT
jgi:hypothetical protein